MSYSSNPLTQNMMDAFDDDDDEGDVVPIGADFV